VAQLVRWRALTRCGVMTRQEELRLSQFRSDLIKILGEVYSELAALRREVRPARLFGEGRVEELMELISDLIAECDPEKEHVIFSKVTSSSTQR
jgi:hypothetical protein